MPTWKHIDPEELKRLEAMAQPNDVIFPLPKNKKELNKMYELGDLPHGEGITQIVSAESLNRICGKPNKYHNQKTDGFDSKKEARRAEELRMMEKTGIIRNLRYQVPFLLQEAFRSKDGVWNRKIEYIADFVYEDRLQGDWIEICEDVKSPITAKQPVFRLKKKLLLYKYPDINFIET